MAEVYRARAFGMAGFEKILVIKRVLDHMAADQEFVDMFVDEARIAVQLQHVNIVQKEHLDQAWVLNTSVHTVQEVKKVMMIEQPVKVMKKTR